MIYKSLHKYMEVKGKGKAHAIVPLHSCYPPPGGCVTPLVVIWCVSC